MAIVEVSSLGYSSAAGPGGLHPYLLKGCSVALYWSLYLLFVKSLEERLMPRLWKTSVIVLLFKGESKCNLHYRSVRLATVWQHVRETIMLQLAEYLEANGLLSDYQFGSREGRSVKDQLLLT